MRQILHAQVGGEVLQDPGLEFVNRRRRARRVQIVAAELKLTAGATQVHHHVLRHVAGKAKTVIILNQRKGQVKPGADAAGGPDRAILNIKRPALDGNFRVGGLHRVQQPPVGRCPAAVKQAGLRQQHRAAAN